LSFFEKIPAKILWWGFLPHMELMHLSMLWGINTHYGKYVSVMLKYINKINILILWYGYCIMMQ
jgi:hypothetical protein